MRQVRWVAACAIVLSIGVAAPAYAGSRAYVNYDSLVVSAGPGENNSLSIVPDPLGSTNGGPAYLITDTAAGIVVGPGCERVIRYIARCSLSYDNPVASLSLYLNDGADTAKVQGGFYFYQVDGGNGPDSIDLSGASSWMGGYVLGGLGNDTIDVQNGTFDQLDCGGGTDTAKIDQYPADSAYNC